MTEHPEERSVMARALLDFERLLGHLRLCGDCYEGACLTTAHQVKATQAVTERARKIAHEVLGESAAEQQQPGGA